MLETFTADTFRPHLGKQFQLPVDADRLTVELTDVGTWGEAIANQDGQRVPFKLTFRLLTTEVIPQAIYRLESDEMEPFAIFLVPVHSDARGTRLEAVFT